MSRQLSLTRLVNWNSTQPQLLYNISLDSSLLWTSWWIVTSCKVLHSVDCSQRSDGDQDRLSAEFQDTRNKIDKHQKRSNVKRSLQDRADAKELRRLNILGGVYTMLIREVLDSGVAPTLQDKQRTLAFQQRQVHVSQSLHHRPHTEGLVHARILHGMWWCCIGYICRCTK